MVRSSPARSEVPILSTTTLTKRPSMIAAGIALTIDHASRTAESSDICCKGGRVEGRAVAGVEWTKNYLASAT